MASESTVGTHPAPCLAASPGQAWEQIGVVTPPPEPLGTQNWCTTPVHVTPLFRHPPHPIPAPHGLHILSAQVHQKTRSPLPTLLPKGRGVTHTHSQLPSHAVEMGIFSPKHLGGDKGWLIRASGARLEPSALTPRLFCPHLYPWCPGPPEAGTALAHHVSHHTGAGLERE